MSTEYRELLERKGLDSEHTYLVCSRIDNLHELVSHLSDQDRIVLQVLLGEQAIRALEQYGRHTRKQASLFVDIDQDRQLVREIESLNYK